MSATPRIGVGYDIHRVGDRRPLVLGGITIEHPAGLIGHSDADVVTHAIADALLGALALGDLGWHFPDSDPRWENASSLDLLSRVVTLVAERGYTVGNVDVTVVAAQPKLAPHTTAMRAALAPCLRVSAADISIKATTGEGLSPEGRGEAIAAHAVVLVHGAPAEIR